MAAKARFNRFTLVPDKFINFGPLVFGNQRTRTFEVCSGWPRDAAKHSSLAHAHAQVKNTGEFDFKFTIFPHNTEGMEAFNAAALEHLGVAQKKEKRSKRDHKSKRDAAEEKKKSTTSTKSKTQKKKGKGLWRVLLLSAHAAYSLSRPRCRRWKAPQQPRQGPEQAPCAVRQRTDLAYSPAAQRCERWPQRGRL